MSTPSPTPGTRRPASASGEQLSLLDPPDVPVQFRLSRETRLRGLAHIAEIRRMLADRVAPGADGTPLHRAA